MQEICHSVVYKHLLFCCHTRAMSQGEIELKLILAFVVNVAEVVRQLSVFYYAVIFAVCFSSHFRLRGLCGEICF